MVTLKIEDDYFDKIISFLKILPKKAVTIEEESQEQNLKEVEQNIACAFDDVKNRRTRTVRTIS
jgi:hypothetical protein